MSNLYKRSLLLYDNDRYGRMNSEQKRKSILYWSQSSEKDLVAAKNMAKLAKTNSQPLLFLHLSIEKALKALFVHLSTEFAPLSHNLVTIQRNST